MCVCACAHMCVCVYVCVVCERVRVCVSAYTYSSSHVNVLFVGINISSTPHYNSITDNRCKDFVQHREGREGGSTGVRILFNTEKGGREHRCKDFVQHREGREGAQV